jgi:ribosomal protein S18 acetylase RimI-like enzyme
MSRLSIDDGLIRRYRDEDRNTVWALSQIPHIGATADPSAPLDLSRDDPGNWVDLWDIHASHIARGGDFLVYELDGRIVAMGAVIPDREGTAEVNYVRVHPAMRRRGIGRAVMRALERRAIELGCVRMHLDTTVAQPEAIAFYRSLGYEEAGREKFPHWELVFFTRELRTDQILSLNSGLAVGDPELAVEQVSARVVLLENLRAGLSEDDRVEALWVHGSLGRGDEDALSDIDLIVMTAEGSDASFVRSLPDVAAGFGPVALANPMPGNAPEGGYFLSVLYDVEPLPITCDWMVWPFRPVRPADVVVLYERDPSCFSVGGTFDEIMSGVPRSALVLESAEALSSRLYMVLPVAKDAARGWSGSVEVMLQYLPFALGPVRSMAHLISMLRELVEEHADHEQRSAVAAVRRYLSGVDRLLPTDLRT